MRTIIMVFVAMVIFFGASISNAAMFSTENVRKVAELDKISEQFDEMLEMRRITKADLEGVKTSEDLYSIIVERLHILDEYAKMFNVNNTVIIVCEDVEETLLIELEALLKSQKDIFVGFAIYVGAPHYQLITSEELTDSTLNKYESKPMQEAFYFQPVKS